MPKFKSKSKAVAKYLKKYRKSLPKGERKRFKWKTVKLKTFSLKPEDLMGNLSAAYGGNHSQSAKRSAGWTTPPWYLPDPVITPPSNSKYNVANMTGGPIDDRIVAGQEDTPTNLQTWLDWADAKPMTATQVTALADAMQRQEDTMKTIWKPIDHAPRGVVTRQGWAGYGPVIAVSDGHTLALVQWSVTYRCKDEYAHLGYSLITSAMMAPGHSNGHWVLVHAGSNAEDGDFDFKPLYWANPKDLLPQ